MRKILLGIISLLLIVSVGYCEEQPLQLTIKSNKEVYEVGDEIILSGYFKNISSEKIYVIKDDKPLLWCRLIVENPQGIEFWYGAYPTKEFGPAPLNAYITILPKQLLEYFTFKAIAGKLLGNEFNWFYKTTVTPPRVIFPFAQVGSYKIKFLYINLTPTRKDALKGTFTSNIIKIDITGKNAQQIKVGMTYSEAKQILERDNAKETQLAIALDAAAAERTKLYTYEISDGRIIVICVNKIDGVISGLSIFEYPTGSNSIGNLKSIEYIEISQSSIPSPWSNKAPYPYKNEDEVLVANSYKEKWIESSIEKYPEAVTKAKEVLRERGQNPDKYEYQGKQYDYKISVSESPNFISVVFNPIGLPITCQQVEIRMTKDGLKVLSILKGP